MYGIIVYEEQDAIYNRSFIDYLIKEGKTQGITLELMLYEGFSYGIRENATFIEYENRKMMRPDFVIYRCRKYLLSRQFETMGIKVFNSSKVCEICNDKSLTYQYMSTLGIPMVPGVFVENKQLEKILNDQQEDMVVKAVAGHGGSQVCLVKQGDVQSIEEAIRIMDGESVVVQPLVKGRGQDLRVYVIGGRIIAAVLRSAVSGFKSNFSLGGSVELYELSEREKELVEKITAQLSLDYAGIDFIIGDNGQLIFNEIEDVVGARMLYQCSDIDIVPIYLAYLKHQVKIY